MQGYLLTTCVVFGLITAAHVMRIAVEGTHLLRDPAYLVLTAAAAGLCLWGGRLLFNLRKRPT